MLLATLLSVAVLETQAAPAPAPQAEERMICKRERVVGSNRPQRICMTAKEWERTRDTSRDQMDRATREQPTELPRS